MIPRHSRLSTLIPQELLAAVPPSPTRTVQITHDQPQRLSVVSITMTTLTSSPSVVPRPQMVASAGVTSKVESPNPLQQQKDESPAAPVNAPPPTKEKKNWFQKYVWDYNERK